MTSTSLRSLLRALRPAVQGSSSAVAAGAFSIGRARRHILPPASPTPRCHCLHTSAAARSEPSGSGSEIRPLSTQEYNAASNRTMETLTEYLEEFVENLEGGAGTGYDVEYSAGVLTFVIGDKGTYVINKQPPNKQIWLSSPISGPKRYDYDSLHKHWFYHRDGTLMRDLLNTELKILMENDAVHVDLGEGDEK